MQAVLATPGGRNGNDAQALADFSKGCARAVQVVNDLEARVLVRDVENLARLLCYADGHVGMGAGSLRGVDALKLQLFNTHSAPCAGACNCSNCSTSPPDRSCPHLKRRRARASW